MKVKLKYPVFAFKKYDKMIYVFFREKDLKSTSNKTFKTLNYKNIVHVDSLGRKFKINKAFKVRYLGLWGFNPFLKGRQILVDFEYEDELQNLSLEEFKEELVERVLKKKRFWQSGWDIEELKQKIKKSETFAELAGWLK